MRPILNACVHVLSRIRLAKMAPATTLLPSSRKFSTLKPSSKSKSVYVCNSCGAESLKWVGSCPACGAWETMTAFKVQDVQTSRNVSPSTIAAHATGGNHKEKGATTSWLTTNSRLTSVEDIKLSQVPRITFQSKELDRLFGGGLVPGSVTLLAGPPGIGKSTLLLQIAALLCHAKKDGQPYFHHFRKGDKSTAEADTSGKGGQVVGAASDSVVSTAPVVAYVSGEESADQIKRRATRLGVHAPTLFLMNETRVEDIIEELEKARKVAVASSVAAIIIDSIQTMFTDAVPSAAGSVTQVKECATRFLQYAKSTGIPVFLVGHVTKSGDIAGPRVLEHLVDTVVSIEADETTFTSGPNRTYETDGAVQTSNLRLMRAMKNRFGSTSEVGIFEMTDEGFSESDAATAFLSSARPTTSDANDTTDGGGSVVAVTTEGTRSLCVEVQALATTSPFAYPRHRSTGISLDRIHMLLAVLSKHAGLRCHNYDLFVNVVGGLKLYDTSADLPLALAITSSVLGVPVKRGTVAIGEVGLGGELRPVPRLQQRLQAAAQLGFTHAIIPDAADVKVDSMTIHRARKIDYAVKLAFGVDAKMLRPRTERNFTKRQHHNADTDE